MLVAEDQLTNEQIAARLGVSRQALDKWKQHPDFQARVQEHLDAWRAEILSRGIADRAKRVEAANQRWALMKQVIAERAADPTMQNVPGGQTGLLVRTYKSIGTGPTATFVEEYAVDTGLLNELRQHEKQTAQELGQWTEKQENDIGAALAGVLERLSGGSGSQS